MKIRAFTAKMHGEDYLVVKAGETYYPFGMECIISVYGSKESGVRAMLDCPTPIDQRFFGSPGADFEEMVEFEY